MTIGEVIKKYRKNSGMTQEEITNLMTAREKTVVTIRTDKREIKSLIDFFIYIPPLFFMSK